MPFALRSRLPAVALAEECLGELLAARYIAPVRALGTFGKGAIGQHKLDGALVLWVAFTAQPGPPRLRRAMTRLPAHVRELFWEGLAEEPDPERHADYIAIRVLESGGEPQVRWLLERYGPERIRRVACSGRLRAHHGRFWACVLPGA